MATCNGKYHQKAGKGRMTVCDCGVKGRSALGASGEVALPLISAGGPVNWQRLGQRSMSGAELARRDQQIATRARMRAYGLERKFRTKLLRSGG